MKAKGNWGDAFGWGLLGVLAIIGLSKMARNPRLSPNLRFIAQTAEG